MADYSNISFKNNGKLKLLIIVGTRPEIIRLAAVINKTRKYFDVILAHTLLFRFFRLRVLLLTQ